MHTLAPNAASSCIALFNRSLAPCCLICYSATAVGGATASATDAAAADVESLCQMRIVPSSEPVAKLSPRGA